MGFIDSIFSFQGFMSRSQYWKAIILYIICPALILAILAILAGMYDFQTNTTILYKPSEGNVLSFLVWIFALYEIFAMTYGMLAVMAKRLRDFSISPWLGILYFIPPLTPFVVLLFGMFPTNVNASEK